MTEHRTAHTEDGHHPVTDLLGDFSQPSGTSAVALDIEEPAGVLKIRMPDILACIPRNARRTGGRHHRRPGISELNEISGDSIPDWGIARVQSVVSAPAVTFHSRSSTFDFFSVKTRRVVYGIGPHEFAHARELEADPYTADFGLQGLRAVWNAEGRDHYTADSVALMADGRVVGTEVKASESYFQDPKYAAVMWNAARSFEAAGITFAKVTGDGMDDNRRRSWNVSRVFHDRGTRFGEREISAVTNLLTAAGSPVALGRVQEVLSDNASVARQMVNAMMCARHLAYDLNAAVTSDTEVNSAPRIAKPTDIRRIGL